MGKTKETPRQKASKFTNEFSSHGIEVNGTTISCRTCGLCIGEISKIRKSQLQQHIETMKHVKNAKLKANHTAPLDKIKPKPYTTDLCRTFISADIPLHKLNNPELSGFLEKYTFSTPDESTIRRNFIENEYKKTLDMMRQEIGDGPIWLSIDETTDINGRFIANVIVGKLSSDDADSKKSFLFHCAELTATNAETIARLLTETIHKIWPIDTPSKINSVFLFVTDAAPYMQKAGKNLKLLYPKMLHITCAAHGIHRVCETIRTEFPLTNSIISSVKKIFLKAPSRVMLLKTIYPELPLPPQPIITRWGTWLLAAEYYADNLFELVDVIRALEDESEAIKVAKATIDDPELITELTTIKTHYVFLAHIITKLEARGLSLMESSTLMNEAETKISTVPDKKIKQKFTAVFEKNTDLQALSAVAKGDTNERLKFKNFDGMSPSDLSKFKFAPIVTCEVERSFSIYKNILTDRRRSFTIDALIQHLIIACYNNQTNV